MPGKEVAAWELVTVTDKTLENRPQEDLWGVFLPPALGRQWAQS